MKNLSGKILTYILVSSFFISASAQDDEISIIQKSSEACIALETVRYFISKTPLDSDSGRPTFKGTISIAKDDNVENPIFDKFLYHGNINITGISNEKRNVITSFNGQNLYIELQKGITTYENPTSQTIMRKLGLDLYLLILQAFIKPNGLEFLLERELTLLQDSVINGIPSYHIRAITYFPISPGSSKMERSISDWFFSKHENLPIAYKDKNYFSSFQILERNFSIEKNDFTIVSNDQISLSTKTNEEVRNENLLDIGSKSPNWMAYSMDGKIVQPSDYIGKIVLIDFWGTWCPPCIKSMPSIQKIHEKYDEVVVIGIAVNDDPNKVQNFINEKGFSYMIIPEGTELAKLYNVAEYPTLYILNKKGEVTYREKGYNVNGFEDWSDVIEGLHEK